MEPKPKRTALVKIRAVVAWLLVLTGLAVAVLVAWRVPITTSSGQKNLWLTVALAVGVFLLTMYAITLFFGSLGLYIAAGFALLGLFGLLAGYGDHNDKIVSFGGWCLGIAIGVAVMAVIIRLLFGRKEKS
jgi:hypothetical protein